MSDSAGGTEAIGAKKRCFLTVTFFGHRNTPEGIRERLKNTLIELVEKEGARSFYVGNEGAFDRLCQSVLRELRKQYPLDITVVFAYMPTKAQEMEGFASLFPEAAAIAPPRFAIERRNRWMASQSDLVVTYVITSYGGAAKAKRSMQRAGKRVIELSK